MLDLEDTIRYLKGIEVKDKCWRDYDLRAVGNKVRVFSGMDYEEAAKLDLTAEEKSFFDHDW